MTELNFWEQIQVYSGFFLTTLCVIGFILTPYNMNYRDKKHRGELDPNKSPIENFFSIP